MYLIRDATAYILIYCGGTKISFSIFIFLSAYYKYEKYKNYIGPAKKINGYKKVLESQSLEVYY